MMKKKRDKRLRSFIILIVFFSSAVFFLSRCGVAIVPVTTHYAYKPILKFRWENKALVSHFPSKIPKHAKNVKFYYRAGFMQGGTTIELSMRLPQKEFDAMVDKHRPYAQWVLDHMENPIGNNSENTYSHELSLHFYTMPRQALDDHVATGPLPSGYEIFLLHLKGDWNHGKTAGFAIHQQNKEIIYWAESW